MDYINANNRLDIDSSFAIIQHTIGRREKKGDPIVRHYVCIDERKGGGKFFDEKGE